MPTDPVEVGLFTYLGALPGLAALVGKRIYPMRLPDAVVYPAVGYRKISGPRHDSHSGSSGLAEARFQFDVWAVDYLAAKQVAQQLVRAFDGYRGSLGQTGGVSARVVNELDEYQELGHLYRTIIDVMIMHQEAVQ